MIKNSRNVYEAQFSLIIAGEKLDFDEITSNMALIPTKTVRSGAKLSTLPLIISQEDGWYFTIELSNPEGSDNALQNVIKSITEKRDFLDSLEKNGCRITLRLALTTDKAFIGYRLTPETICTIQSSGYPLDITTVSWGEI